MKTPWSPSGPLLRLGRTLASSVVDATDDGAARPKPIDPFGYHLVGCRTGANAIRLHDEVVSMLARLFRCLRVDAIVEPIRIFADLDGGGNSQRPDILLRNPRGFGRQVIIDVAITGIDGQSRTSDELTDRPLRVRYEQKKAKYGPTADRYNLQFVPAVFSHTGQVKRKRVSPPHPFFTSKGASREVCVKEGRNLMKCVGSTGVTTFSPCSI